MKNQIVKLCAVSVMMIVSFLSVVIQQSLAEPSENLKKVDAQLYERIDFGNSYILGQSIKSGAVYLLQRKKSDIESMLKVREHYRNEILEDFTINDLKVDKSENSEKSR